MTGMPRAWLAHWPSEVGHDYGGPSSTFSPAPSTGTQMFMDCVYGLWGGGQGSDLGGTQDLP